MADPVRIGVVGVGAIGRHHARILAEHSGAELVGLHDTDPARAAAVAERHAIPAFAAFDALLAEVEAVVCAVPTLAHREVGLRCLEAGADLLIEKPIARSLEEADELLGRAATLGRVLQVGHIERYNPAVQALMAHVHEPAFIEVHRLGSFAPRSLEVDVILDLMIHDIDVVHALTGADVGEIRAVGMPVLSDEVDIANVRLELTTGCVVNMTASRVSMNRVRKLRVFQPHAYFSVDYSEQEVACFRLEKDEAARSAISAMPVEVAPAEPLVLELDDFVRCVRTRELPRVDGAAGRRALATALAIQRRMRREFDPETVADE